VTKKGLDSISPKDKKVLVRVDFNVPIKDGKITDDTRISESLPTLRYLLKEQAAVILCSHMGRPKGTPNPKYTLKPVAERLSQLIGKSVQFAEDCVGENVRKMASALKSGEILLLENLRFHAAEEKNDVAFAKELASLADLFVQDAFGSVHRAHASTVGITQHLTSVAGLLLQKELDVLGKVLKDPPSPIVAILGGAKVSDKIAVIRNLSLKADTIIIGGAMAYTFLKAKGQGVGRSLVENDKLELAKENLKNGSKLNLPVDHIIAEKPEEGSKVQTTSDPNIPEGWLGVDIGPKTSIQIHDLIKNAKMIFWNGPLGIFEITEFSKGTMECAKSIAEASKNGAFSVVGGGDSVAAIKKSGLASSISHISTGGGASLEFLEGKTLPGVAAIPDA